MEGAVSQRQERLRRPKSYRGTSVPVDRSAAHIEALLTEFGAEATSLTKMRRGEQARVELRFIYHGIMYVIGVPLGEQPQEHRQRMRALVWFTKATLEAVVFGLLSAEEALLPFAEIRGASGHRTTIGRALLAAFDKPTIGLPRVSPEEMLSVLGATGLPALPAPGKDGSDDR